MNLTYEERLLLAIYLEFFNRCYDLNDDRKYEVGPGVLVRHVEMQNIAYLVKNLLLLFDYCFTWNIKGPYSSKLQSELIKLDEKEENINQFYEEYNIKRKEYNNGYKDQLNSTLSNYLSQSFIKEIAFAAFVLESVLKKERGSEILAAIIYIGTTVHPGKNLSTILSKLKERGYSPNPELIEEIWRDLALLNIREIDTKSFTRERKLVNNNNGVIL